MFSISILFCYHSPPSGVTKHTQIATKESTKSDKFCVILSHTPIRSSPPEQETKNKIRHIAIWIPHRHGLFSTNQPTSVSRLHGEAFAFKHLQLGATGVAKHFQNISKIFLYLVATKMGNLPSASFGWMCFFVIGRSIQKKSDNW